MPGAERKLIARHNQIPSAGPVRVNLHVAVSESRSLYGFFSTAAVCSHFYVRKDGGIEQYIDTAYRSKADYEGGRATISVETQGGLYNAQGEPWTQAQLVSLGRIFAWARKTHGIADRLAVDSLPGPSSHGLSWHRLGIDPWRKSGGLRYSLSTGKVCPGNAKIAQIPQVLALSRVTLASDGSTLPGVPTVPDLTTPDPLTEDDDMPYTPDEIKGLVKSAISEYDLETATGATDYGAKAQANRRLAVRADLHHVLTGAAAGADPTFRQIRAALATLTGGAVDEAALASSLAPLLVSLVGELSEADLRRIGDAVNDALLQRLAE